MAMTSVETRPPIRHPAHLVAEAWVIVESSRTVSLTPENLDRLITDCPTWALWDPGIDSVTHEGGTRGEPGMLCRLMVGTRRFRIAFHYILLGHRRGESAVYAGGWHPGRLIDVVDILPRRSSTEVVRRLEIRLLGRWRYLRPVVSRLAKRHLNRCLDALA